MPDSWSPEPVTVWEGTDPANLRRKWTEYCGVTDLPDERRAAKPWLPEECGDRDVTAGRVYADDSGKPECRWHGAMNRVDPHARIYRCQEMRCGVGAQIINGGWN